MKRNDKYVFTTRTIQRVHRLSVENRLCSYRYSSQESTVVNSQQTIHGTVVRSKSRMVRRGRYKQKKKLHLAILTRPRKHQDGCNIQFVSTEWHVQK